MEKQEKYDMERLVDLAALGNRDALEELLGDVQDMVFNLSLRMLGTVPDAEDACQEILIKVMTHCLISGRKAGLAPGCSALL